MANVKAAKKFYLVASTDGSWHYDPVEAESPEDAVLRVESEAVTSAQLDTIYAVYELKDFTPILLQAQIRLMRR